MCANKDTSKKSYTRARIISNRPLYNVHRNVTWGVEPIYIGGAVIYGGVQSKGSAREKEPLYNCVLQLVHLDGCE